MEPLYYNLYGPKSVEFDADAFEDLQDDFYAFLQPGHQTSFEVENQYYDIYRRRPLIEAALKNEDTAPDALLLVEAFATAPLEKRLPREIAKEMPFRANQMVNSNLEQMQALLEHEDQEVAARALRLIYSPADEIRPDKEKHEIQLRYLGEMAHRIVQDSTHPLHSPEDLMLAATNIAEFGVDTQLEALAFTVTAMAQSDDVAAIGKPMFKRVVENVTLDDLAYGKKPEVQQMYLENPELLSLKLRTRAALGNVYRRLPIDADKLEFQLIDLHAEAEALGATKDFGRTLLSCIQRHNSPQVLYDFALSAAGINRIKIAEEWDKGRGDKYTVEQYQAHNMSAIAELELNEPGSAKVLMEEFDISNFSRYPVKVLLKQYRNRNDRSKGRGVAVVGLHDHNSAFNDWTFANSIQNIADGAQEHDVHLDIYEASTALAALKACVRTAHRSVDRQLRFGFVAGHGNESSIQLDEQEYLSKYNLWYISPDYRKRLARLFAKGASIILDSCSTGRPSNESFVRPIAAEIAEVTTRNTTGPDRPSWMETVAVAQRSEGTGLLLEPRYNSPDKAVKSYSYKS